MRTNSPFTRFWHSRPVRGSRALASPRLWYRYVTAARRGLPNFIIAGAQKAGTTSLFGYLRNHPQCAASLTKEVHYYDKNFARGGAWYRMHFPLAAPNSRPPNRGTPICFEASPYYMFEPRVPQRIRRTLPEVKLIFLLRNPVTRAYSHYQHSVRRRRETLSFEDAIAAEPARLAGEHERLLADATHQSPAHQQFSYLARGIYVDQLQRWLGEFPRTQTLILQSEQLFRQPADAFRRVLEFLGLDAWTPTEFGNLYSGRYKSAMAPETRERLSRYFAPHNRRLFELLGTEYEWE